ncbi:hypothetical protein QNH39_02490 [Neobacillus novalis]|uniref:Uncharacterized protein n=1 Tax=Neobacillus novalis TaxID=220687 RepID=A0AA95MNN1_9BACI|nr:hypothetical protein [Neobacillus novalis]WHY86765.1 hypothetical protein QNH39_02490 [Neobacillus novalis]
MNKLWVPSLIISLGIIIGCYLIASKPLSASSAEPKSKNTAESGVLIDLDGASKFLGLPAEEIQMIISNEKKALETSGVYEGMMLPYITVDRTVYFEKTKLLLWAQQNAEQHTEYSK